MKIVKIIKEKGYIHTQNLEQANIIIDVSSLIGGTVDSQKGSIESNIFLNLNYPSLLTEEDFSNNHPRAQNRGALVFENKIAVPRKIVSNDGTVMSFPQKLKKLESSIALTIPNASELMITAKCNLEPLPQSGGVARLVVELNGKVISEDKLFTGNGDMIQAIRECDEIANRL